MKRILKNIVLVALFALPSTLLFSQDEPEFRPTPKWISDKGYWIIESNIKSPDTAIIHFYNNEDIQVYSEIVEGITLNLKKRKTLMGLKKVLDESLVAWEQSHVSKDNAQLVRAVLKPKANNW
jgi:hypothetical protein